VHDRVVAYAYGYDYATLRYGHARNALRRRAPITLKLGEGAASTQCIPIPFYGSGSQKSFVPAARIFPTAMSPTAHHSCAPRCGGITVSPRLLLLPCLPLLLTSPPLRPSPPPAAPPSHAAQLLCASG